MKKFKKWIIDNEYSQTLIAKKLSITPSGLSRYLNGSRKIPLSVAVKIERLTKGEIKCRDLA